MYIELEPKCQYDSVVLQQADIAGVRDPSSVDCKI